MSQKQQGYQSRLHSYVSTGFATSALMFAISSTVCQAFSSPSSPEPSSVPSLSRPLMDGSLTITQAIPPIPSELGNSAIISIPGLPAPLPVYDPPIEPVPEPVYEPVYENSVSGGAVGGSPSSPSFVPAPIPFSLKSVRQSVNIALPSEPEVSNLPELPFKKIYPNVLGYDDAEVDGRRVDFYQFEGNQDQRIVMVLRNSDDSRRDGLPLMPYMTVFDPNGKVMAGTIIPGQHRIATTDPLLPLDNQLALRLPQSGRYIVAVFTDPATVGRYGIGWTEDGTRFQYDEMHELTGAESTELSEITGKAGQTVRVEALSYEFDPIVTLVDANGNIISKDDDDGGNYNARINITLPADGTYRAIVSSANGRSQGQYRLRMR